VIKSWTGPLITGLIVLGIGGILLLNIQSPGPTTRPRPDAEPPRPGLMVEFEGERPIGDPVVKNHVQVAAVYLAAVAMDGAAPGSAGGNPLIHLEADIKAIEGNLNGFAKDEFIPYLKVGYEILPARGGPAIDKGELFPMVASDGLHYGANVAMPRSGEYRLHYDIQPPSAGGLGRHSDKTTGVAPWWEPFRATFEWNVEPKAPAVAGTR